MPRSVGISDHLPATTKPVTQQLVEHEVTVIAPDGFVAVPEYSGPYEASYYPPVRVNGKLNIAAYPEIPKILSRRAYPN